MLHVEYLQHRKVPRVADIRDISRRNAFKIGFVQVLALVPGFSRSGAAIIGGMYLGLSRSTATDFSFLLAVPVILSATLYSVYLKIDQIQFGNIQFFTIGFFASFFSALLVIKLLIVYLRGHSLIVFAIYRIVVGLIIIIFGALA